jgi:hypothetical protein
MRNKNHLFLPPIPFLLLLFFNLNCLSSCSFLGKKIEALVKSDTDTILIKTQINPSHKLNKKNLYCFENNKTHLLLEDEATLKYYQEFLSKLFESQTFSFIQKAAMLSLIEMSRRPDESPPGARFQYYLRFKNKDTYFDFRPIKLDDDSKMPFLKGVETLLKNFDGSKNLEQIAEILDKTIPPSMNVSSEFENFLRDNRTHLLSNDYLYDLFFKGDEVLTKYESFKRISLKKLVNYFYSSKISDNTFYNYSKNSLFSIESQHPELDLKCNADITKDNAFKEEFFFQEQKKSHSFAIKEGDNYFMAVSTAIIKKPFKNINSTYFLKSLPAPTPIPVCHLKNERLDITLFSTSGRKPSQHLKHLISYDLALADSYQSLEELLNFSRHLFLSDPDRILYESKRGRKSQLEFFLTMNFPIYHVPNLGEIIGSAAFKNNQREERSLVIDDRGQTRLSCGQ